jgi:protein-S-isoprenylcysteine O-methyltransferase Ste14
LVWHYLIEGPWVVFCIYWAVGALNTRRTVTTESFVARARHLILEITGFVLLFGGFMDIGVLGERVFHRTYGTLVTAVALTWIGIALALWARWHLGQYWSGRITLKEDHKLIRTGPYAHFRHPIYSGIILAAIGTALAIDEWRGIAGVAVIVLAYLIKGKKEESVLAAQFGEEFKEHCRHTGFLIPRF